MKRAIFLLLLVNIIDLSAQSCSRDTIRIRTGVDNNGVPLPIGASTPLWQITSGKAVSSSTRLGPFPRNSYIIPQNSAWDILPNTQWVFYDPSSFSNKYDTFNFQRCFCVDSPDYFRIKLKVLSDDISWIKLSNSAFGTSIQLGQQKVSPFMTNFFRIGSASPSNYPASGVATIDTVMYLDTGRHCLDFTIADLGAVVTGLDVDGIIFPLNVNQSAFVDSTCCVKCTIDPFITDTFLYTNANGTFHKYTAFPQGTGYTYQWYRGLANSKKINGATSPFYIGSVNKFYTVEIKRVFNGDTCYGIAYAGSKKDTCGIDYDLYSEINFCDSGYTNLNIDMYSPGVKKYAWSTGETTSGIKVVSSGLYFVTICSTIPVKIGEGFIDSITCCVKDSIYIKTCCDSFHSWITADKDTLCFQNLNDSATLTAHPDNNVSYLWLTGATSQSIKVRPGNYCVIVSDTTNGCSDTMCYNINMKDCFGCDSFAILGTISATKDTICTNKNENSVITLSNPGISRVWKRDGVILSSTGNSITVSIPGVYCAYILLDTCAHKDTLCYTIYGKICDSIPCEDYDIEINGNSKLCDSFVVLNAVQISISNGTVFRHSYKWSTGATTQSINASSTGWYSVTVCEVKNNGGIIDSCCDEDSFYVAPCCEEVKAGISTTAQSICVANGEKATLTIHPDGFKRTWLPDNGSGNSGIDYTIDAPGVYCVILEYTEGCLDTVCITIKDSCDPECDIQIVMDGDKTLCSSSARIQFALTGSILNPRFKWSTGERIANPIYVNNPGTYSVTVCGDFINNFGVLDSCCEIAYFTVIDTCSTCNDTCDWHTNGNANIQAYNFIGPRNSADFKIRTNNAERMTVEANGNVGIGLVSPGNRLELNDNRTNTNRSGLRLTELNAANRANTLPISNTVLSVDNNGDVILVNGNNGSGTVNAADQGVTLVGNEVRLGDVCGSNGGRFKSNREINMDTFNLYFNSGISTSEQNPSSIGKIYMGGKLNTQSNCKQLETRLEISARGLNNNPLNSFASPNPSISGLRFTDLTNQNTPIENDTNGGVLSLDRDGDVIWVKNREGVKAGTAWLLGGNFNPSPNYIGTNSNHDFNIHTNAGGSGTNRRAQYTKDGNYDFGVNNKLNNSIVTAVNGRANLSENTLSSFSFGDTNTVKSSEYVGIIGRNNKIDSSNRVVVLGGGNVVNLSNESNVLGEDLTLRRGHGCFLAGGHSTVNSGIFGYHISLGKYCDIDGGFNSVNNYDINIGSYNLIRESGKSSIIGDSSSILNSLRSYSYGNYNNIVSGNNSFVFGSKIGSFASNSMRFGFNNNRTMTLSERGISIQVNPGDGSPLIYLVIIWKSNQIIVLRFSLRIYHWELIRWILL
jgi:hypothetical protein